MLKVICLSCFILLIGVLHSTGQTKRTIAILTNSEPILIPLIEKKLEQLQIDGTHYFNTVLNLNEYEDNLLHDQTWQKNIVLMNGQGITFTKETDAQLKKLANLIEQYDFLLNINVIKINSLLEYQFYLYKTHKQNAGSFSGINDITDQVLLFNKIAYKQYSSNFILDITQKNYSEELTTEILKMFPDANRKPTAIISNKTFKRREYILNINDTLNLDASYSNDSDISTHGLSYTWFVKQDSNTGDKVSDKDKYSFISSIEGTYDIILRVFDGVQFSRDDTVTIFVRKQPQIFLAQHHIATTYFTSLLKSKDRLNIPIELRAFNIDIHESKINLDKPIFNLDTFEIEKAYFNRQENSENKLLSFEITPSLDDLLKRDDSLNYNFVETRQGFKIVFRNSPFKSYKSKYIVTVTNKNLVSNAEVLQIEHTAYSPVSFVFRYEKNLGFGTVLKNSLDTIHTRGNAIAFGFSCSIYNNELKGFGIEGRTIFGGTFRLKDQIYYFSRPVQIALLVTRPGPASIKFGVNLNYYSLDSLSFNAKHALAAGFEFEGEGHILPSLYFIGGFGGTISGIRFENTEKSGTGYAVFGLRYVFKDISF